MLFIKKTRFLVAGILTFKLDIRHKLCFVCLYLYVESKSVLLFQSFTALICNLLICDAAVTDVIYFHLNASSKFTSNEKVTCNFSQCSGVQLSGRGRESPLPFFEKKCLDIGEKCHDCVHLWIKYIT